MAALEVAIWKSANYRRVESQPGRFITMLEGDSHAWCFARYTPDQPVLLERRDGRKDPIVVTFDRELRASRLAGQPSTRHRSREFPDRHEGFVVSSKRGRPMAGADNSLWFKINEDKGGEVVYFKRRNGKLWKLGDGTFGVVYVVHSDLRGNDFAVKLLYDNESTTPRSLSRLPAEAVSAITQRVLEEERVAGRTVRASCSRSCCANYRSPDALALAVSKADVCRLGVASSKRSASGPTLPQWSGSTASPRSPASSAPIN